MATLPHQTYDTIGPILGFYYVLDDTTPQAKVLSFYHLFVLCELRKWCLGFSRDEWIVSRTGGQLLCLRLHCLKPLSSRVFQITALSLSLSSLYHSLPCLWIFPCQEQQNFVQPASFESLFLLYFLFKLFQFRFPLLFGCCFLVGSRLQLLNLYLPFLRSCC